TSTIRGKAMIYNREMETNLPNPVRGRLLKEPEGRVRWLQKGEASRLIKEAEQSLTAPHLGPLVRLALNTGMRVQEMLGLEWSRVDLKNGLIYLGGIHTKSKKRRSIPINKESREALLVQARFRAMECPDSPWVFCHADGERIGSVKRSFATACKSTGIKDFRFHALRHTFAAWLVTAGVPLTGVRDLLGHSSITMTEKYAHLAPERVREAVAVLDKA
ncbi:MAG: site-specific integrase, partial [Gammaproteobacteria bacterium]|nr:site-specific integrase [Gammaproteobacteria bacterium]